MYLLRLMMQTGPLCTSLSPAVNENVLQKVNRIVRANVFSANLLAWVEAAVASGEFLRFAPDLQNELLDTLCELAGAGAELSARAQRLYNTITKSLMSVNK